jgi:hypothetical protein
MQSAISRWLSTLSRHLSAGSGLILWQCEPWYRQHSALRINRNIAGAAQNKARPYPSTSVLCNKTPPEYLLHAIASSSAQGKKAAEN